jgi:hypothetical protein
VLPGQGGPGVDGTQGTSVPGRELTAKAFRFRKQGGDRAVYDVAVTEHGPQCDCPGFTHWHPRRGTLCKHVKTLKAAGMIS